MQLRLIVGFAVVGALAAGIVSAARERDFRAHSYVIRVPPAYGGKEGLRFARSDRVLRRALALAGVRGSPAWLRRVLEDPADLAARLRDRRGGVDFK